MKEGYYKAEELSNEAYHADEALGNSGLKEFADVPYKYKYKYLDGNRETTKSLTVGAWAHEYILENEKFQYSLVDRLPSLTSKKLLETLDGLTREFIECSFDFKAVIYDKIKRGKEYSEVLDLATAGGAYVLKEKELKALMAVEANYHFLKESEERGAYYLKRSDLEQLKAMRKKITENKLASRLLGGGVIEMSFFAKHPKYKIMMKARPDCLVGFEGVGTCIVDYKTTCANLKNSIQSREAFKWDRHIQAAFHKYVVEAATGGKIDAIIYVTQESKAPYLVRSFVIEQEEVSEGLEEIEMRLEKFSECFKKNEWPEYPEDLESYVAPGYFAHRKIEL